MLQSPPSDDICYATQNRQQVVKDIAAECDVMLVVGSKNSSNSVRLVEVAVQHGAKTGHLIDFAHEIDGSWLEGASTVGLSSGASVPDNLVQDVLAHLAERGFTTVEEFEPVTEKIAFSLPRELAKDLKAAGRAG
jgi:4-hydroxy-3-methylbut-2-enyl diphosphate reductase